MNEDLDGNWTLRPMFCAPPSLEEFQRQHLLQAPTDEQIEEERAAKLRAAEAENKRMRRLLGRQWR